MSQHSDGVPVSKNGTKLPDPFAKQRDKTKTHKKSAEHSEDLAQGQIVIVSARWILVIAGLVLTLWAPDEIGTLRIQLMVLLILAVANFYLHTQLLMRKPTLDIVTYAASAADLVVITTIVLAGGGFDASVYVFYFPAVLAFSVAFPTILTFLYTAAAGFIYAIIALVSIAFDSDAGEELQVLITRLIMLLAIAVCGNLYMRIERGRRQAAAEAREDLMAEIGERSTAATQSS